MAHWLTGFPAIVYRHPVDEHEEENRAYWEEQSRLPWRERDRLWWIEVAFPTVVITVFLLAVGLFITFEL